MTRCPDDISDAVRVLHDLVATPSVSGNEHRAAGVLLRHATHLGLRAEIDEAGNALAHRGPADAATHIMLLGHIDTVPGHIPVRIENNTLHGRGSVDAKGPLAAMLIAAARAKLPRGVRVTVAGAVGEETARSPGARHLVHEHRPHACIIGEPSAWDGITLGYKGRLIVTATARREQAHSAGPHPSACDDLHAWWSAVLALSASFNEGRTHAFEQLQASIRDVSSHIDGMRQHAELHAGFRLPITLRPDELAQDLRSCADDCVELAFDGHEQAFATERNDPVVRALSIAIRAHGGRPRPKRKTGTSDMNVVAPHWQCPIAAYGPGDSALDHTPHERLDLNEYERSIHILEAAITTLAVELTPASAEPAPVEAQGTRP